MVKGYLCLLLHAHLPYVRHPEYADFLEEDWLYEAITETYIPFLTMCETLTRDGVDFRLTLSISPTLSSMLRDPLLQTRYLKRLDRLAHLADREVARTKDDPRVQPLAHMYRQRFLEARSAFADRYGQDLIGAFRHFQEIGKLEIITCAATHALLPLMTNPKAVRAQIAVAVRHYEECFGRRPRGIWLPECGYCGGLDEILKECGLEFFFVEAHGILYGQPRPKFGVFAPVRCHSGVYAFGRDQETSKQVWSSKEGYPGDPFYREFYRDIGFDLDYDYVRPYFHGDGARINTGIKYYRITGSDPHKLHYDPAAARARAEVHAAHFVAGRKAQVEHLCGVMGRRPVITAPYDAELFGHWWYEGPLWLEYLCRKARSDQDVFQLVTPSEYLAFGEQAQTVEPAMSTWGWKGYNDIWLSEDNEWIYRHLHAATDRMVELAERIPRAEGLALRALNQAARELLLAQSSDWAFIMKTGTMVEYAVGKTKHHLLNFLSLAEQIGADAIDGDLVRGMEEKDNIFPRLDYRVFAGA